MPKDDALPHLCDYCPDPKGPNRGEKLRAVTHVPGGMDPIRGWLEWACQYHAEQYWRGLLTVASALCFIRRQSALELEREHAAEEAQQDERDSLREVVGT